MSDEGRQPTDKARGLDGESRYQPALDYVALDRAHRKRSRWSTVLAISVIVLVGSLVMLGVIGFSYWQGQAKNSRVAEHVDTSAIEDSLAQADTKVDWDALRAINPDTVAWLYIPGTAINYPVVQGEDNDYYLSHDFTRDQGWLAQFGAIFLDWRNNPDWSDQACFIYGHHMNDGSMFADIAGLADQSRFDASRTVYLLSPDGNFRLRAFSLIHCASDDPLVQVSFSSASDMEEYVQDKMSRSIVQVGSVPAAADITKLFAFATCDNYSSGRYVLYTYVEQVTGDAGESTAARGGSAADRTAESPSTGASAAAEAARRAASRSGEGDVDAEGDLGFEEEGAYSEDDDAYYPDEEDAEDEAYYDDDAGVTIGDSGDYAGGYYTYDEDGDLRWVSTE